MPTSPYNIGRAPRLALLALLTVLALFLPAGCVANTPPPAAPTPLPSASPSASPPEAVGTLNPAVKPPGPVSSVMPTLSVPQMLSTAEARRLADIPPTPTSSPTRDPRLPTYTPTPSPTPSSTPTTIPPPILLTDPVPDPQMADVRYFPSTGHTLRGVFLDYWQGHGGAAELGNPITEEFVEYETSGGYNYKPGPPSQNPDAPENTDPTNSGKELPVVQYFEKARLERYPTKAGTGEEFHLTPDGEQLARQKGYYRGLYPRYGHAVDFSWIAGIYNVDYHMCQSCGCVTIQYNPLIFRAAMLPYGAYWAALEANWQAEARAKTGPSISYNPFVVLFGHMAGDPTRVAGGPCSVPSYLVTRLQQNPAP